MNKTKTLDAKRAKAVEQRFEFDAQLGADLRHVLLRLGRMLRQEAYHQGLTPSQAIILAVIGTADELGIPDPGVRELAALEGVAPPTMSKYVDRLVYSGLVKKLPSASDGRRVSLRLTRKGVTELTDLNDRRLEAMSRGLAKLPEKDLKAIAKAIGPLSQLLVHWRADVDGTPS